MAGATFTAGPDGTSSASWSGATVGSPLVLFSLGGSVPSGWTEISSTSGVFVATREAASASGTVTPGGTFCRVVAVSSGPVPTVAAAATQTGQNLYGASADLTGLHDVLAFACQQTGSGPWQITDATIPGTLGSQVLDATGGVAASAWEVTGGSSGTVTVTATMSIPSSAFVFVVPVSGAQEETTASTVTAAFTPSGKVASQGQAQTVASTAAAAFSASTSSVTKHEGEVEQASGSVTAAFTTSGVPTAQAQTVTSTVAAAFSASSTGLQQDQKNVTGTASAAFTGTGATSQAQTVTGRSAAIFTASGSSHKTSDNASGLAVRLIAYSPNGDELGPLPTPLSWSASIVRHDKGALSLDYSGAAPASDLLSSPVEVALQFWNGSAYQEADDARYLVTARSTDDVDPSEKVTYGGVSQGFRLSKVAVYDGPTDGLTPGERRFTSSTPGRIMATLAGEAQDRGALAGVDISTFSKDHDSSGAAWAQVISIGYQVGITLADVLQNLVDQGMVDAVWSGRTLRLFNPDSRTTDRTLSDPPVILRAGRDVKQASNQGAWDNLASTALVRGDGGLNLEVSNANAEQPWGRWETVLDDGGVTDEDSLQSFGNANLATIGQPQIQHTHDLNFLYAGSLPLVGYRTGDYVYSDVGDGLARLRVAQITLQGDESGITTGNVILNDRLTEAIVALNKRVNGIRGGSGGTGPVPAPIDPSDRTTPSAPTGFNAETDVFLDDNGAQQSQITATWTDPTTNTDGSAIDDLFAIQLWGKPTRSGTTYRLITTQDPGIGKVTYSPLPVGDTYDFYVTALDHSSHVSEKSGTVTVVLAKDTTPPAAPAAPVLSSDNANLTVSTQDSGTDAPIDLAQVLAYVSTSSSVPINSSTYAGAMPSNGGSLTIPNVSIGSTYWARLVAVDQTGNRSAASNVSASCTVQSIDGGDIGQGTIGSGQLGDGSVGAQQIDVPGLNVNGDINVQNLYGEEIQGVSLLSSTLETTGGASGYRLYLDGDSIWFEGPYASRIQADSDNSLTAQAANELRLYGSGARIVLGGSGSGSYMKCPPIHSNTTTNSANVYVAGNYTLQRSTSLRRFKVGIQDATNTARVLDLRPANFRDKGEADRGENPRLQVGLIAEEVAAAYPELATYGEDGQLNGVAYDRVAVALLGVVKDLAARIDALEGR